MPFFPFFVPSADAATAAAFLKSSSDNGTTWSRISLGSIDSPNFSTVSKSAIDSGLPFPASLYKRRESSTTTGPLLLPAIAILMDLSVELWSICPFSPVKINTSLGYSLPIVSPSAIPTWSGALKYIPRFLSGILPSVSKSFFVANFPYNIRRKSKISVS